MRILHVSDDLMGRVRLESRWQAAGATLLKRDATEPPELIAVDLTAREALARLTELRARWPQARLIAYGPHVDAEGFRAAKEAGADECVARGSVVDRVLTRLAG